MSVTFWSQIKGQRGKPFCLLVPPIPGKPISCRSGVLQLTLAPAALGIQCGPKTNSPGTFTVRLGLLKHSAISVFSAFCNERQPLLGCLYRLLPVSHSNNPTYIHLLVLFLSRTLTNTRGKEAMVSGPTPALLWPTEHPSPPRAFSLPRFLSPSLPIPSRPV